MTRQVRRRYLALKIEGEGSLQQKEVADALWNAVLRLFGEVGLSQAGLYLVNFDSEKNRAVLRCSHRALSLVRAAVASVTKIGDVPAAVHVLRVSGTLKALGRKTHSSQ